MIPGIQHYTAQGTRPSFQGLFLYLYGRMPEACFSTSQHYHPYLPGRRPKTNTCSEINSLWEIIVEKATKNELDHVTGIDLDTLETTQTGTQMEPKWNTDGNQAPAMPRAFCPGGLHPASVRRFRIMRASSPPPGFCVSCSVCVSRPGVPSPRSVFPFVCPPGSGRLCRRVAAFYARRSR